VRKVLLAILVLIAGLVLVIQSRPSAYHIERSVVVQAPAPAVYAHVADFHQWNAWSPWDKFDPAMKKDYAGDPGAVGSSYQWAGNDKVGEGKMTITKIDPPQSAVVDLEFVKPFASSCTSGFAFAPEGAGTKVTWWMDGKSTFMTKAMSLFGGDMDKMVGPDFERGLTQLKTVVEASPAGAAH
jgi:hypothetical protein